MALKNIIKNLFSRGTKDILDPEVWKTFSDWRQIEKNGLTIPADQLLNYSQQVVYRASMCPECVKAKECHHCHCTMPEKMLTPSAKCSAGKWGPMQDNWQETVEKDKLEFITIIAE